jgi:hypothetical protein
VKLSYPGAKKNILKLVAAGILKEEAQRKHPQLDSAPGILEVVSAF